MPLTSKRPRTWSAILALGLMGVAGCAASSQAAFPDHDVSQFVNCVSRHDNESIESCTLDRRKLNYRNKDGWTPLLWLLAKKHISPKTMIDLINMGANPHHPSSPTAAGHAIQSMPLEYLESLVGAGLDVNSEPKADEDRGWHYSFIFSAILSGDIKKVEYLLDHGANLELKNEAGQTPILTANPNLFDIQVLLLQRGADPTVIDKKGFGICTDIEITPYFMTIDEVDPPYREDAKHDLEDRHKFLSLLRDRGIVCAKPGSKPLHNSHIL